MGGGRKRRCYREWEVGGEEGAYRVIVGQVEERMRWVLM